jgi:uncharacterized protein with HEPN domain
MPKSDLIRLKHMLDAAKEAASFLRGKPKAALGTDRILILALTRSIEIIGEAASQVSKEFQKSHPQIVGMRNRLIHAYFDVDMDRVWDTVMDDLPPLTAELEKIISQSSIEN